MAQTIYGDGVLKGSISVVGSLALTGSMTVSGTVDGRDVSVDGTAADAHIAATAAHGATGAVVGTTNSQTLTNKTLTAPVIATISNTGLLTLPTSTDTIVGRATTDTLTNKTLTTPTIASFANSNHTHQNSAGGGTLDHGLAITGLSDDDHTIYALLAGRSGGQILTGGTAASDRLKLVSTSNGTKGHVSIGTGDSLALYNTADETTNYERMRSFWSSNIYTLQMEKGGTGTSRSVQLLSNDGSGLRVSDGGSHFFQGSSAGFVFLQPLVDTVSLDVTGKVTTANRGAVRLRNAPSGSAFTASSGNQAICQVIGTFNQTSTASLTGLEVNMTLTATGSGAKKIFDGIVGGASVFFVDSTGKATMSGARFVGYTSSIVAPTTTELPTDKDFALHKDTALGVVYLAYNDGGVIKKVALA